LKTTSSSAFQTKEPRLLCNYIEEPKLCFADGYEHIDPKYGILSSGPKSLSATQSHPSQIRVGIIGTAETIDKAQRWIQRGAEGIDGDKDYLRFPGFKHDRGFDSEIMFDNNWNAQISQSEVQNVLSGRRKRFKFEKLLDVFNQKLQLIANKDRTPECIVLAIPDLLYRQCRVVNYVEKGIGDVHRDLRRAFKAMAMKYRIPTQIIRQQTIEDETGDVLSKISWNFFTGMYFKAGGFPWGPIGLAPGTCYIGISFFRPLGSRSSMQTSLVQAFDEHGDGLVLRGYEFEWDENREETRAPHLTAEQASSLVELALERYKREMGQTPQRVVIHKSSRYWPDEENGFRSTLEKHVTHYDLTALARQSLVRLMPVNKYPPLRGTYFSVDELDFLYTTGYIAELGEYHGLHVPAPIQIADHIGQDTPRETLLKEIMILTKMNWNSARLGGLMPITLRFSQLVGDIMREIPMDQEPLASFKFYM
jgi:hypothetical protein